MQTAGHPSGYGPLPATMESDILERIVRGFADTCARREVVSSYLPPIIINHIKIQVKSQLS